MAKNEINTLLLGAGESGKVRRSNAYTNWSWPELLPSVVNVSEADEAHPQWRITRL